MDWIAIVPPFSPWRSPGEFLGQRRDLLLRKQRRFLGGDGERRPKNTQDHECVGPKENRFSLLQRISQELREFSDVFLAVAFFRMHSHLHRSGTDGIGCLESDVPYCRSDLGRFHEGPPGKL